MIDCDRQKQFIKMLKYRYMIATGVLIEAKWNVNVYMMSNNITLLNVLIEAKWNVNTLIINAGIGDHFVLIEAKWNVNSRAV